MIKDVRDFGSVKEHSRNNDGIFRKYDRSQLVEVINIGKYGYISKIFTTERTLRETGVKFKYI